MSKKQPPIPKPRPILDDGAYSKQVPEVKEEDDEVSSETEQPRRARVTGNVNVNVNVMSLEFQLADELTDQMFAVLIGNYDMGEARKNIREWWRAQDPYSEGPFVIDGQSLNRVEYIRKLADKIKNVAEALSQ